MESRQSSKAKKIMIRSIKILFLIMINISCLSLTVFSQVTTKIDTTLTTLSDGDLVLKFGSQESVNKTRIAVEIFGRGEKMIPLLMNLKGNELNYNGFCLGDPEGADSIASIPGIKGSRVTIQVAALYLVNAIYFNSLHFANVPYLSDKKQDKATGHKSFDYNTAKRVKKAWEAAEKWFKKYQTQGLDALRNSREFPLKSANIYFVGTNPNRKRDFLPCKK